jgi:hypothetical protein
MSQFQLKFEFHALGKFITWWDLANRILIAPSNQQLCIQEI